MDLPIPPADERHRLISLVKAEGKALSLLDAVEAAGLIAAGRTERAVEKDIYALAAEAPAGPFGGRAGEVVEVRAGDVVIVAEALPERLELDR